MITFLGMGLLGSNFVRALRRRGEEVHVWNRTHERAKRLEADGARAFADVAAAVRGASAVHITLSDDASVDAVLAQAEPGLSADALLIDHTTTSTEGALRRTEAFRARGITYVHAPVFMGPQNARDGTGLMLVSGDKSVFERVKPRLEPMTGTLWYVNERTDGAAAFKLLGNLFLMFITSGVTDLLALAKAMNVEPTEAMTLFQKFNPGTTVTARMQRIIDGKFNEPSWELAMARKDARLMTEEAERGNVPLTVLPAIIARMDELLSRGHGHDDWTVIAKDFVSP